MGIVIGTPNTAGAVRLVLLGSGELGREVALEAKRLGCEVVAVDRYAGAPAMQVADRHAVIDMTDPQALRALLEAERARPCAQLLVVPEIEAIATPELERLEAEGMRVIPTARAARLTMDREGIRRLAAEELGLATSPYRFCDSLEETQAAVAGARRPVRRQAGHVLERQGPVASWSAADGAQAAWDYAQAGGRTGAGRVIVEGFVAFDYEITLLTVRHAGGHVVLRADRPCPGRRRLPRELAATADERRGARAAAVALATTITDALGGHRDLRRRAVRARRRRRSSARSRRARTTPAW